MSWRHAVLLAAILLFFWRLEGHDLWAPDEPYFAEGAREMVVDGRWFVPHVNGVVTPDKPPLFFWLIALFSLPQGTVTAFTARLPSALAALGTVALTMRLGVRELGPRTGALAGAVLSTSFLFWNKARWSQTDSLLCLLIWVALSAFASFRAGSARGRRAGLLFWLAAALAVLTKGPVGLLLPLGIIVVTLAIDGEPGRWRRFAPVSGPLLFAGVVGTWMMVASLGSAGEYSAWRAFQEHFIERAIYGLHHKRPPWYFPQTLPASLLPWTGLVPGALVLAWRRRLPSDRFLLAIALFVVLFFSVSAEKRDLYVLPAVPAFALMVAGLVSEVCGWGEPALGRRAPPDRRWLTVGQGIIGGLLALGGLALTLAGRRIDALPDWLVFTLGVVLFAGGAVTLWLAWRGRALGAALAPAASVAAVYLIAVTFVAPALDSRKSARPFALRIKEVTETSRAAGLPVVAYHLSNLPEAFAFYSDGVYMLETLDPAELQRHLERPEQVFAVVDGDKLDSLPRALLSRLYVAGSARLSRRHVLLIVNGAYPGSQPLLPDPARAER